MAYSSTVPSMKKPRGAGKQKEWIESIAMFTSNNMSLYTSKSVRASVRDKIINLDLYNNRLHVEDFISLLNPLDLKTIEDTRELQHFPVAAPIIDLLVGEEIDRPFEPIVDITNNIAIDEKKERLRAYVDQKLKELEKLYQGDEETLKIEVKKFSRYLKYTYKDIIEKKASALLEEYYLQLNIPEKFTEGFRRVWLTGEEAYEIDIVNGAPTFEVLNTSNVRLYGGGRSNKFSDYDLIVVEDHYPPGYLIDRYGSMLKEDEVDRVLNYETNSGLFDKTYGNVTHEFVPAGDILGAEVSDNFVDESGGIRHLRLRFKAYKQIQKIVFQDPASGAEQVKVVSIQYKLREGEALLEKVWIVEWWILTVIGADIIVDAHPIPVRYNRLGSLSEGHPGIVGRVYNINEREVIPPMTRIRSYQYLYDVTMDRIIVAMSKNVGPILEMDFAKRPSKWGTMKWLGYMFKYNVKFVDNFKEASKGSATGQLAGNLAAGRDQMQSFDFSGYIQQLIGIAEYLEKAMADTLGIVPQRLGAVSNRETVGGIERATSQSSHITEWYFYQHEQTKLEALNIFIEAAKTALKDNPRKLRYTLDSKILEILDVTEEDLANIDLGVTVTNSKKAQEYKNLLQQASHAFMQNGGEFSFIFDILNSNSMAEKRKLIEEYENEKKEQVQEQREAEQNIAKNQIAKEEKTEAEDRAMEKYKIDTEAMVKIKLKEMDALIANGQLTLDKDQSLEDMKLNLLNFQRELDKDYSDNKFKKEEIDIKKQEVKIKEKALNKKPVTTNT